MIGIFQLKQTKAGKNQNGGFTSKGLSTRDRILDATRKRLISGGYDALVMRELADELDIKLGNLQYYFKTKELLVLEVLQIEADRDIRIIQDIRGIDAAARFRAIVKELVSRWRGDTGVLFSILSTLALHSPAYKELYRKIYSAFYEALVLPLTELNPSLSDDEVALRVRLITALIDGSPMQVKVGSLQTYLGEVQTLAEQIARS